jgi:hypothetical protein
LDVKESVLPICSLYAVVNKLPDDGENRMEERKKKAVS